MSSINFQNISLDSKPIFDKYFSKNQIEISEYSFTNLFVWHNTRNIQFSEYKEGLILLADYGNEKYFLPPIGYSDYKEIISFLLDYGILNNIASSVRRVCEVRIEPLENSGFKIIEDRDNFDYIYNSYDLAHLKGRKYSGKRNFVTNFLNEYDYQYKKYDSSYHNDCLLLCEKWLSKKDPNDKSIHNEYDAIKELLNNSEKLNAIGGVLLVDDKVEAFAFGEKLNDSTFVIHFEKANAEFKGIYQVINKIFIENEIAGKFNFVNREQDMGIQGMRKAKESYFPIKMVKKYIITS